MTETDEPIYKYARRFYTEDDTKIVKCNRYAMELGKLSETCETCDYIPYMKLAEHFSMKFKCILIDTRTSEERVMHEADYTRKELYT